MFVQCHSVEQVLRNSEKLAIVVRGMAWCQADPKDSPERALNHCAHIIMEWRLGKGEDSSSCGAFSGIQTWPLVFQMFYFLQVRYQKF